MNTYELMTSPRIPWAISLVKSTRIAAPQIDTDALSQPRQHAPGDGGAEPARRRSVRSERISRQCLTMPPTIPITRNASRQILPISTDSTSAVTTSGPLPTMSNRTVDANTAVYISDCKCSGEAALKRTFRRYLLLPRYPRPQR